MLFLLLFCISFLQLNLLSATSFAFNPMSNTHQSTKNTSSVVDGTNEDKHTSADKDEFAFADDEDELYTSLKNKTSFRAKAVRTMRSIKKHSALLVVTAIACAVAYAYWYNIWPFSATLAPVIKENEDIAEEQVSEDIKDIENKEKINDTKIIPEVLPSQENSSQTRNESISEELVKISKNYEQPDSSKKLDEKFEFLKNKYSK